MTKSLISWPAALLSTAWIAGICFGLMLGGRLWLAVPCVALVVFAIRLCVTLDISIDDLERNNEETTARLRTHEMAIELALAKEAEISVEIDGAAASIHSVIAMAAEQREDDEDHTHQP